MLSMQPKPSANGDIGGALLSAAAVLAKPLKATGDKDAAENWKKAGTKGIKQV